MSNTTSTYKMNEFEQSLYDSIVHNSILFLEKGVSDLVKNDDKSVHDIVVLSCTNIQISLELALRAYIIRLRGINSILDKKQQSLSKADIEKLYVNNKLKVIEFDGLKNQLKSYAIFQSGDFKIIDTFQTYRNKLVHFCCNTSDSELEQLSDKLMYYIVHIVLRILYNDYEDLGPAIYFEKLLGYDFYTLLRKNKVYIKTAEDLAAERSKEVGICTVCNKKAYSIDEEICYFCNYSLEDSVGRVDCTRCGGCNTVIYDSLNIHLPGNRHSMRGFCQQCQADPDIFECPICKQTHNLYDEGKGKCYDGHCVTKNVDYDDNSFVV